MPKKKKVKQNEMTNHILSIVTTDKDGDAQIFNSLVFERIAGHPMMPSTHRLLLYLCMRLAENGQKDQSFSLQEYMEVRHLSDRTSAREQMRRDINTLMDLRITYETDSGANFMRDILVQRGGIHYGNVEIRLSDQFYEMMKAAPVMDYPVSLLGISGKNNEAFYIGTKIATLRRINKKDRKISVRALLNSVPTIPSPEVVERQGRHYKTKIIIPLEKGMDTLLKSELQDWHYEDRTGAILEKPISWNDFIDAYICYSWNE